MPLPASQLGAPVLGSLNVTAAPTAGQGLALDASGKIPSGLLPASTAPGTSFPTSPKDGDTYPYLAAAGVLWNFMYQQSTGKWLFVGGPPMFSLVTTSETTVSTTYAALTTAGPSVTLPFAGDFDVEIGCGDPHTNAAGTIFMSYDIGGTGAVDGDSVFDSSQNVTGGFHMCRRARKTGLTAVALTAKYRVTAGTGRWQDRYMAVWPVQK